MRVQRGQCAGAFTSGYRGVTGVNYSGYRGVTGASYSAYRGGIGYGYRPYYGAYHGYYHSNFYRPYYHHHFHYWPYYFPFAFGFYFPYYGGLGGYYPGYGIGPAAYDSYLPPVASDYSQAPATPPATDRPPPDDAAHLQLTVPENAEVLIDDNKTMQTGKVREFVSPPLKTGTQYSYRITVRYTNADGKPVDDTRDIRFTANDWFAIDFTRPPPAPTAPQPKIVPKGKEE